MSREVFTQIIMKSLKIVTILFVALALSTQIYAADKAENSEKKTAESVMVFAGEMETFDAEVLKVEMDQLSAFQKIRLIKLAIKDVKMAEATGQASVGLYVLAVLIPPLAVGIYSNWTMPTLYNLLWTCLFGFPGIIHAFIVLGR